MRHFILYSLRFYIRVNIIVLIGFSSYIIAKLSKINNSSSKLKIIWPPKLLDLPKIRYYIIFDPFYTP
jgi:hypothetical protein